ncbi:MAG: hypothetical protein E6Q68_07220 [Polynucleobacter sp.]|jgi:hypothetical protein|nr:MAG: hypothetical protein E6Q68_07220 [Polynucleobacter sp.]
MNATNEKSKPVKIENRSWDRRVFLKVKLKSLAAETRVIRSAERKSRPEQFKFLTNELRCHRIAVVRREARATNLAYAFIRGRKYKAVEAKFHQGNAPDWTKVEAMVRKYGRSYDPDLSYNANDANFNSMMKRLSTWKDEE